MSIDMNQFYQVFFEEAAEHLAQMESLLLGLDVNAPSLDDLNAIFRAAHSIKGGAGTFGFTDMTEATHIMETLLDKLRKEEIQLREEMVDVFLQAGDVLKMQLEGHQNGAAVDQKAVEEVCRRLKHLAENGAGEIPSPVQPSAAAPEARTSPAPSRHLYQIEFTADPDLSKDQDRLDGLFAELKNLGQLEIAELQAVPEEAEGDTGKKSKKKKKAAASRWNLKLSTDASEEAIREIFAFVAQPEQVRIEASAAPQAAAEDPGYGFFTDVEANAGGEDSQAVEEGQGYGFFAETPAMQSERENKQGYGFFQKIAPPPAENQPAERSPGRRASDNPEAGVVATGRREGDKVAVAASAQTDATSIRVSVEKVDQLINLVGELVITQAMLAQTASKVDPVLYESLLNGMGQLERNTRDLQESVMSIRMMPIGFVFSRFPRVVRDIAGKLGKQVELKTLGEGTELDKGLIEKIADPLTHLVRNSLDHGIESPEKRIAAGKDPKGTVTLRAGHQGGNILIEVADDGAGLNREKILAKAKERGLPVHEGMNDQEVWQLIFEPGFSTADVVTDVSGRGVGMDVVKRNIHGMGGSVDIDSAPGYGTRMTIRLPLTLAILDGMSIGVGDEIYIAPLTFIAESLQPAPEDIKTVSGQGRVVQVRGEYLPLIALHSVFSVTPKVAEPHQGIVVLLESEGKKIALFVDELLGQHQVVIKSLESNYRKVAGVSGATIMGDGKVALILDVSALIRMSQG
ncbi:MAG: chemotaxis protein CheA [Pseudomonadota bacterium]